MNLAGAALALDVKKLYYSIGEVSEITGLKPYVLRYWETEFSNLAPSKNPTGNRAYTQKDINVILAIKRLLYQERFTIEGARNFFKGRQGEDGQPLSGSGAIRARDEARQVLEEIHASLGDLLNIVRKEK